MRSFSLMLVVLLLSCSREPAMVRQARKAELAGALSRAFLKSVEAEKSAVLATTDEESGQFASESRNAASEVGRLQRELEVLIGGDARQPEKGKLAAFSAAWTKVAAIDAQLLPLAVANTNLKAAHLSSHEAAAALERLVARLDALEARSKDPARIRRLAAAAVAALTIQTLHPPHIVSSPPSPASTPATKYRVPWAQLLQRTFATDVLTCNKCGGPRRVVACVFSSTVAREILQHLRLPARPLPRAPARAPPQLELYA